jgi:hypothetical protein
MGTFFAILGESVANENFFDRYADGSFVTSLTEVTLVHAESTLIQTTTNDNLEMKLELSIVTPYVKNVIKGNGQMTV